MDNINNLSDCELLSKIEEVKRSKKSFLEMQEKLFKIGYSNKTNRAVEQFDNLLKLYLEELKLRGIRN